MREGAGGWKVAAAVLFAWGFGLCLHYGRIGLMPLDQSIVWDGGWRLAHGQVPFRDFTTPAGLVPMALQAVLFRLFGATWFGYCAHAAALNGAFCVLSFRLLRGWDLPARAAVLYSALGGVVFYPPFGVPYMDQHAFFFSLAAITALLAGLRDPARGRRFLWLAPWLLAAAYLSKQIPSVFVAPLVLAAPLLVARADRRSVTRPLLQSCAALLLVGSAAAIAVDRTLLTRYFFVIPGLEGRRRLLGLLEPTAFRAQLDELLRALPPLSTAALVAGAVVLLFRRGNEPGRTTSRGAALLALALVGICAAFVMETDNQGENGIPFVFLAAGLVHAGLVAAAASSRTGGRLLATSAWALAAVCSVEAWLFNQRVNETRMVHELSGVPSAPEVSTRALPPALSFLEWRLHPFYRFTPEDLALTVAYLKSQPGGVYVFGDLTILYALTGRPSVGPSVWLHPGLTMPAPGEAGFPDWENRLRDDLVAARVRFVVRESRQTYSELRLSQCPGLVAYLEAHHAAKRSFGGIDVLVLESGQDAPR